MKVITDGKQLYCNVAKESTAICRKVECAVDADDKAKQNCFKGVELAKSGTDVAHDAGLTLDMLVVGSVAVSRSTGQRIGRGFGYVDLDYAVLRDTGAITDRTVIVTIVHDDQVYDELPAALFAPFDMVVDMIVTPTQVIRVAPRPKRTETAAIDWTILSQRRIEIMPALKLIREAEEKYERTSLFFLFFFVIVFFFLQERQSNYDQGRGHRHRK